MITAVSITRVAIAGLVCALFALPTALIVFPLRGAYFTIDKRFREI
jgi:ABC-type branched-subunit amino acid transport system permease subunit